MHSIGQKCGTYFVIKILIRVIRHGQSTQVYSSNIQLIVSQYFYRNFKLKNADLERECIYHNTIIGNTDYTSTEFIHTICQSRLLHTF